MITEIMPHLVLWSVLLFREILLADICVFSMHVSQLIKKLTNIRGF